MDWEKHYSFGDTIREDNLAFSISFADNYPYDPKADYFFFINSLEGLVDSYGQRLGTESMGEKSNIVVLSIVGEAITKEKDFLNTLMATYIKHEQDKQNFKGERTVKFIEKQLDASSNWWQYHECTRHRHAASKIAPPTSKQNNRITMRIISVEVNGPVISYSLGWV